ncbi:MAG: ion transporter [Mariprofundus sp.]
MPEQNQPLPPHQNRKTLRSTLNCWLFDLSSPIGRRVNLALMTIIVLSVIVGMLGTVKHLEDDWQFLFYALESGVVILFILEYMARLYSAHRPLEYALSFYGIIDLATILPVLIIGDTSTAIRLLRVLRMLKLVRYLRALQLFISSMKDVLEIIAVVVAAISIVILVAGNLIYFLEPQIIADAFEGCWWSLVTMTTVGYGDIVPQTTGGRILASSLIVIGVSMFAMLTGVISVKLSHTLAHQRECHNCERKIAHEFIYCPFCSAAQQPVKQTDQIPPSKP